MVAGPAQRWWYDQHDGIKWSATMTSREFIIPWPVITFIIIIFKIWSHHRQYGTVHSMAVWHFTIQEKQEKHSAAICASALISYLSTPPSPPCPNHTASKLHSLQFSAKNKVSFKHSFLFNKNGRDKLDLVSVASFFVTIQEIKESFSITFSVAAFSLYFPKD